MSKELIHYLNSHYSPKTVAAYQREIEIYLANNPQAASYRYQDVVNYIGVLRKRYSKPRTLNRLLSSIKSYYDFLAYSGRRNDNPTRAITLRDKQSRDIQLQDLFTPEELESLLNSKKETNNRLEYRNKVLISLFIYQALKPTEAAMLSLEDINLEQGTMYIKPSAKSNSRTLPLKVNQILLFHQYITEVRSKLLKRAL